jgi:hypothetical protein
MLIRISLIVAIVAGLGIAGLNFAKVQKQITDLVTDRDHEKSVKETTQHNLAATNKVLVKVTKDLNDTKEQLATTSKERDDAVAQVEEVTKKDAVLTEKLKKTEADRDDARNELAAWKALGIPIENIKATLASLKQVKEDRDAIAAENKLLNGKVLNLKARLDDLTDPEFAGPDMPTGLRGKVLVADPKYNFVVLNIGEHQGVLEAGRFLVSHNGRLVAKVKVKSIQPDQCIANVLPGWNLSEIEEGDQVIY